MSAPVARSGLSRLLESGPAGAAGSRRAVYLLGVLAAMKAAGLVLLAEAIASAIASLAQGELDVPGTLAAGVAGILLRTGAAWGQEATAHRLAVGVKERLRQTALGRFVEDGGHATGSSRGTGSLGVLLTRGLDGLDSYYTQYLPALVTCAVVPLLIGARILAADWISAVVIMLTIPLVPLFMILIGLHTQEKTQAAVTAMARLSDHLLELAKGLPVLVGLGRAAEQTQALRELADAHTGKTMATLRVAFLSSLALELISTLSVAVVAVFAGVRLIHGDLGLETALVALILAPECYGPLREIGAAHHASEDGKEVGARVRARLDAARPTRIQSRPDQSDSATPQTLVVQGLSARFDATSAPLFSNIGFTLEPGSITALRGPSGSGKSTLMNLLASGVIPAGLTVQGTITGRGAETVAWVPQHPVLLLDTVEDELGLYAGLAPGHPALAEALRAVDGESLLHRSSGTLSPGELRRVAVARALVRATCVPGVRTLLLDEPTAHVDAAASTAIRAALARRRPGLQVLLIAHDDDTAAIADRTVWLGSNTHPTTRERHHILPGRPVPAQIAPPAGNTWLEPYTAPAGKILPADSRTRTGSLPQRMFSGARSLIAVLRLVQPWNRRFVAAALLGLASALFAVALTALSGWLIVRASTQPPILYLLTAIVGVRFFGIGRSVLRYAERLWLHAAVFARADAVRIGLWRGLLHTAESWRTLARGSGGIEKLVGDVEELRDISARAVFPPVTAVLTGGAAVLVTFLLHPGALGWQLVGVLGSLIAGPWAAVLLQRSAGAAAVETKAVALSSTVRLLGAAADLQANGLQGQALRRGRELDRRAASGLRRIAWAAGSANAIIVLSCTTASLGVLTTAGSIPAEVAAVLALMQLALIEPFAAGSAALQHWDALGAVVGRVAPALAPDRLAGLDAAPGTGGTPGVAGTAGSGATPITRLELDRVSVGYAPGHPVVTGVSLAISRRRWTALTGPSGSGKSTLLGATLGFLPLMAGRYLVNGCEQDTLPAGVDGAGTPATRRIAWCPQESHLFASTIRANLQLARPQSQRASDAELLGILETVGLAAMVRSLDDGLDAPVGAGGSRLSGGQRQRLAVARALLTDADVLLLDEPTAHLDADGARALLADLRIALHGKAVLLITHDAREADDCDEVVVLDVSPPLRWEHEYA